MKFCQIKTLAKDHSKMTTNKTSTTETHPRKVSVMKMLRNSSIKPIIQVIQQIFAMQVAKRNYLLPPNVLIVSDRMKRSRWLIWPTSLQTKVWRDPTMIVFTMRNKYNQKIKKKRVKKRGFNMKMILLNKLQQREQLLTLTVKQTFWVFHKSLVEWPESKNKSKRCLMRESRCNMIEKRSFLGCQMRLSPASKFSHFFTTKYSTLSTGLSKQIIKEFRERI